MNRTPMKTYTLTITEKQARALMDACELLSRIQGGQVREVFEYLPLKKGVDWEVYHQIQDELTKRMPEILKDGINGWSSSFGVGHPELPESHDISWDLYQVIRHKLSWERAVEEGVIESENSPRKWSEMMGVSFDPPMKWSNEKLAIMTRIE
jgi:hypothetical protein